MTQVFRQRMEEFGLHTAIIIHRCTCDDVHVTMPMGRGRKDRMVPTHVPISVTVDVVYVIIASYITCT